MSHAIPAALDRVPRITVSHSIPTNDRFHMTNAPTIRGLFRPEGHPERTLRCHAFSSATINRTQRRLLKWGRLNYRDYRWRSEPSLWLSFVAEFLLQRTRASQVELVFDDLATRFPTARSLADSDHQTARCITARLGLHARGPQLLPHREDRS